MAAGAFSPSEHPGKVLVTGGTGHLGANLVRRLLADGHDVRALVEPGVDPRALADLELERFVGDVRDEPRVREAMRGCAWVFHVAAKVSTANATAAEEREIFAVNVLGTRNLLRASLAEGVRRLCLTGSFSGIGVHPDDPSRPVDETLPFYPYLQWLPYARSKVLAEHELLKAVAEGLDAVVAVSTGIVGPNDFVPSRTGRALIDFARGKMRVYVPGGTEFVTTDDMVEGHLLAMAAGRRGHRYLFSTEFLSLGGMLELFGEVCGRRSRPIPLPPRLMHAIASASDLAGTVFPGLPQRFTRGAIKILTMNRRADTTLARTELGFRPGSVRAAVAAQYEFFRRQGMI